MHKSMLVLITANQGKREGLWKTGGNYLVEGVFARGETQLFFNKRESRNFLSLLFSMTCCIIKMNNTMNNGERGRERKRERG